HVGGSLAGLAGADDREIEHISHDTYSAQHESFDTSRLKAWAPILSASLIVGYTWTRSTKSARVAWNFIAIAASWMISLAPSPMTWTPRTRSSIVDAIIFTRPMARWIAPARGTYSIGVVALAAG